MPVYSNKEFVNIVHPEPDNWDRDMLGIPFIEKEELNISNVGSKLFLINPNNVSAKDADKERKIIHSFVNDTILEKTYKNPIKFVEKISGYYGATSLDFTMSSGMSRWSIVQAVGKNRWFGRYLQSYGIKVYPTVGWVDEDTYDICFAGLRYGSVFFISTLGTNNELCRTMFLNGLFELRRRFPNSRQICIGTKVKGIPEDVCLVPYNESFGGKKQFSKRNQIRLFNWDGTLVEEDA